MEIIDGILIGILMAVGWISLIVMIAKARRMKKFIEHNKQEREYKEWLENHTALEL